MQVVANEIGILRFIRDVDVEEGGIEGELFRIAGRARTTGRRRSILVPRGRLSDLGDRKLIVWMHEEGARELPENVLIGLTKAGSAMLPGAAA